jgi:hypothetical protein
LTDCIPASSSRAPAASGTSASIRARSSSELDVERSNVLLEVGAALGAGDRDDVVALSEQPGERKLGRRHALFGGELLSLARERQVALAGSTSSSRSRVQIEYSVCTAASACTACARRIVSGEASLKPMYKIDLYRG